MNQWSGENNEKSFLSPRWHCRYVSSQASRLRSSLVILLTCRSIGAPTSEFLFCFLTFSERVMSWSRQASALPRVSISVQEDPRMTPQPLKDKHGNVFIFTLYLVEGCWPSFHTCHAKACETGQFPHWRPIVHMSKKSNTGSWNHQKKKKWVQARSYTSELNSVEKIHHSSEVARMSVEQTLKPQSQRSGNDVTTTLSQPGRRILEKRADCQQQTVNRAEASTPSAVTSCSERPTYVCVNTIFTQNSGECVLQGE